MVKCLISIIPGDGTLNEVLVGMYNRTDHKSVPVGVIPSGTKAPQLSIVIARVLLGSIATYDEFRITGSTDTVACTLHGTRDSFTAVFHVVLGDKRALDIGAIRTPQQTKPMCVGFSDCCLSAPSGLLD